MSIVHGILQNVIDNIGMDTHTITISSCFLVIHSFELIFRSIVETWESRYRPKGYSIEAGKLCIR